MPLKYNKVYSLWIKKNDKDIFEGSYKGKSPHQAGRKMFHNLIKTTNPTDYFEIIFGVVEKDNTDKRFIYRGISEKTDTQIIEFKKTNKYIIKRRTTHIYRLRS